MDTHTISAVRSPAADAPRVERREALVASTVVAAVFVVVGYATGLGITMPSLADATIAGTGPLAPGVNYVVPPGPDVSLVPIGGVAGSASDASPVSATLPAVSPKVRTTRMPTGTALGSSAATPTTRSTSCSGISAAERTLLQHLAAGHLEEGPTQQLADLLNPDQYVRTHTTLVGSVLGSLLGGVTDAQNTLLQHIEAGHLGESPSQQLADILDVNQYAQTHTALVATLAQSILGEC